MTNVEKQNCVMEALGDYLAEYLEKNCPVTIAFRPCRLRFEVYGTKNEGYMQMACNAPGQIRLQLGVCRKETDRLYSHFMPAAAAEEMACYLRDPAAHRDWMEQIAQLSARADDYWD